MKEAFTRVLVYLFIFTCFSAIFQAWPTALNPNQPLANKIAYYVGYYVPAFTIWALIYELIYRICRSLRRKQVPIEDAPTTELHTPETRPFTKP